MDIYELCRICVSHSDTSVMMSIFGEDALWKKITSFANVHIEEGDSLPQQICIQCAKNTINAFIFKQKCEEADSYFRKELLKKMELRLPDDTEIITIASGGRGGNGNNGDKNTPINMTKKHKEQQQQQSDQSGDDFDDDNFPTLIDANAGLVNGDDDGDDDEDDEDDGNSEVCNGDNWDATSARHNQDNDDDDDERNRQSSLSIDEKMYDDNLPLIPEIELITPNDDDDDDEDGNVIGNINGDFGKRNNVFRRDINGQYQCNICYKTFPMKSILKHHMKTCYQNTANSEIGDTGGGKKNQIYECYVCKKSYLSKRFLEKHIRMSRCVKKRKNTTRPMQCSECRTLFPTGHHLGWHKRTGNCRSGSPKLSLTEYEQKNDSDTNSEQENNKEFNDVTNSGNQKRKKYGKLKQKGGRTRIKLDAKKIAYATELVKQQVSTTKFAQELKISRTFAWRLRKTLENNMYKEGKWMTTTTTTPSAVTASASIPTPIAAATTTTMPTLTSSKSVSDATTSMLTKNFIPMTYDVKKQINSDSSVGGNGGVNDDKKVDSSMIGNNLLMQPHNMMTAMMAAIMMDAKTNLNNKINLEQLSTNYLAFMNQKFPTQFPAQMLAAAGMGVGGGVNIGAGGYQNDMTMKLLNNNKENTSGVSGAVATQGLLPDSGTTAVTAAIPVPILDEKFLKTTSMISELKNEIIDNTNQPLNYQKPRKCKQQQQQQDKGIINEHINGGIPGGDTQTNAQRNQFYGTKIESVSRNNKRRKPRKPNVAINEEKYLQAKILIANNVSTMEIAKILNISQMSAWKLRDCIMKNIPFPHHNRKQQQQQTQLQHTQHQLYPGLISNNNLNNPVTTSSISTPVLPTTTTPTATATTSASFTKTKSKLKRPKFKIPRQRLKRDERLKRDLIIKKEILSMIKEDNNIQYWKVSVRLAEKGYPISPSSVCQRLKSMGIHRRLKINEQQQQEQEQGNEQQQQQKFEQNDEEEEQSIDSNDDVDDDDDDDNDDHVNNNGDNADALSSSTSSSQQRNIDLFKDHSHFLSTHFNNLG